jgi:hypothetical protein
MSSFDDKFYSSVTYRPVDGQGPRNEQRVQPLLSNGQ